MDEATIRARITTDTFPESINGLMLCGINWGSGGDQPEPGGSDLPSFFSDINANNARYAFQKKIRKWFKVWGYPLEESVGRAGYLEKCISQTNWLGSQSRNANAEYNYSNLVARAGEEFLPIVQFIRPRFLIFFGITLPYALNAPELCRETESILGPRIDQKVKTHWLKRADQSKRCKQFRITQQRFERCYVLGLPHPTPPSNPVTENDILAVTKYILDGMSFLSGKA